MNLIQLQAYATMLDAEFELRVFDGGQRIRMSAIVDGKALEASYYLYWGDDEARWLRLAERFLDGLPWPTEEDPRVQNEGVTL